MTKANEKIKSVIEKHRMISQGDTVIVAVSGGADSMCLLHFFNSISSEKQLNIICAHVNHGIRGDEAIRDENFVRSFCEQNLIRFECANFDVPFLASQSGESEEQCGRRLRYEFFASLSDNAKIATAHNLNDCAETFIFNLARGTGLKGLTGIPAVRDNIIRPLIECTREEIEEYLSFFNITYVTDSTNLNDDYSRNRIRHNIIPVLKDINPSFFSVFENCISVLSETEKYISDKTEKAFLEAECNGKFGVSYILSLENIIKNRLLKRIAESYGAYDVSAKHIELLSEILLKKGAVMLHGEITIASDGDYLFRTEEKKEDILINEAYSPEKKHYVFPGCIIDITPVDKNEINNYNSKRLSALGYADAEKIENSVFRSRCDGDRFRYPHSEHSKSLKNLFKEKGITNDDRWGVPFLADKENILWINGIGVSEYAAITAESRRFVKIVVTKG